MIETQRRRLIRHGFVLLVAALTLGLGILTLPHPRAWLAAHVAAFLNGLILVAIGLVWRELRLTNGQRKTALVAPCLGGGGQCRQVSSRR